MTKDEMAQLLADEHAAWDEDLRAVYRLLSDNEDDPEEPVKLLEVSDDTPQQGLLPLYFDARPQQDRPYSHIVATITPYELRRFQDNYYVLPQGWRIGPEIPFERLSEEEWQDAA